MRRSNLVLTAAAYLVWSTPGAGAAQDEHREELVTSLRATVPLEAGWADPPRAARTRAWWWWLNGNVNEEAITRDLAQMRAKGLGGANIIDAGGADQRGNRQVPHGPDFASPQWRRLFIHALREADRQGLEMGFNITSGWNLGGPDVQPDDAAKRLTWAEATVTGGSQIELLLPMPATRGGYYRDVRVVAFPVADGEQDAPIPAPAASSSQPEHPPHHALDQDVTTFWVSGGVASGEGPTSQRPQWLELRFDSPVTADRLIIRGRPGYGPGRCRFETASTDGVFRTLVEFEIERDGRQSVSFEPIAAARFRLVILSSHDPAHPDAPRNVQIAELVLQSGDRVLTARLSPAARIDNFEQKAYYQYPGGATATEAWHLLRAADLKPGESACRAADVIDLSSFIDESGILRWTPPRGTWRILRFGCTLSGARVSTHSENWAGWAIDYLDRGAFESYWDRVVEPILDEAGPLAGRSLRFLHTDSWELGPVNWTPGLPGSFRALRGYDMLRYMPALAGYVVDDPGISTRFLNDFRRTLADLIAENKYAAFAEHAGRYGLGIHPESGGPHAAPVDALQCLGRSAIPMGEFWARADTHRVKDSERLFVKQAASAAHVYGRRLVLAEAFTTIGPQWQLAPNDLKPVFDRVACEGLNLAMLHTFDCSPKEMGLPGQAYFAGTHINPNVTWWDQAGAFIGYLNRCQFLLQQGLPVADVLYFYGESIPSFVRLKRDDPAGVLPGYDYDVINAEALLSRAAVDARGRIVLPDGTAYRVLVLPGYDAISLAMLRHIADLVHHGATVVGRKPERPIGLTGYPQSDAQFRALADQLWGGPTAGPGPEPGAGMVSGDAGVRDVLEQMGVAADFLYAPAGDEAQLDYIHRATDDAEIYFVVNRRDEPARVEASFRVTGRRPELWDPLTGDRRDARAFRQHDQRTVVPLDLEAHGSIFVLFRTPIPPDAAGPAQRNSDTLRVVGRIAGPWRVRFDPRWGGPEHADFDRLTDWSRHPDPGVRYYSGTGAYRVTFELPAGLPPGGAPIVLDLGDVRSIAELELNGRPLGVVWCAPFRVDITDEVRPTGNELTVRVTNLWPNRLIGDQHLPADQRYTSTNITKFTPDSPLVPSGLLGPVTLLAP